MDNAIPCDAQAVPAAEGEPLVGPFTEAVSAVFSEMASAGAAVQAVYRQPSSRTVGELSALLRLRSVGEAALVLSCPRPTARALAERVLSGVTEPLDDGMIGDCLGELANVIAGQAKALLAGTPHHFTFSPPTIVTGVGKEVGKAGDEGSLVIVFGSEVGEFALQLCADL